MAQFASRLSTICIIDAVYIVILSSLYLIRRAVCVSLNYFVSYDTMMVEELATQASLIVLLLLSSNSSKMAPLRHLLRLLLALGLVVSSFSCVVSALKAYKVLTAVWICENTLPIPALYANGSFVQHRCTWNIANQFDNYCLASKAYQLEKDYEKNSTSAAVSFFAYSSKQRLRRYMGLYVTELSHLFLAAMVVFTTYSFFIATDKCVTLMIKESCCVGADPVEHVSAAVDSLSQNPVNLEAQVRSHHCQVSGSEPPPPYPGPA